MPKQSDNPTAASPSFPIKYQVLQIEPWTMLDPRGNPIPGYRVTFTFEGGTVDFVDVSQKTYAPESVRAAIEDKITKHVGVLTLG